MSDLAHETSVDAKAFEGAWARRAPWAVVGALVVLYVLAALLRPLSIPDEYRYGEIAREMLASGDWIVPRLDGLRYFEKPPLHAWTTATAQGLLGESAFAVRLASLLATLSITWWIVRLARTSCPGPRGRTAGAWGAAIWLGSVLVFLLGTMGILDGLLSALLCGGLVMFYEWLVATDARAGRRALFLCGLWCGAAFLTKGFLAFAVPAVVAGICVVLERDVRRLLRDSWLPVVGVLLVAGPWSLWIAYREPDFWRYFFVEEHLRRFAGADAHHAEPPWFFVPVVLGALVPWTFLLPTAISGLRQGRGMRATAERRLRRFLLAWLFGGLLFFSASRGKLVTYILPVLPPVALLLGMGITTALRSGRRTAFDRGCLVAAVTLALLGGVLPVIQWGTGKPPYTAGHELDALFVALALFAWAAACVQASRLEAPVRKLACFALGPSAFLLATATSLPTRTMHSKMPHLLLEAVRDRVDAGDRIVSDTNLVHAACWTLERSDVFVLGNRSELTYGLAYSDARGRALDHDGVRDLIASLPSDRSAVVLRKLYEPAVPGEFGSNAVWEYRWGSFLAQEFHGARSAAPVEQSDRQALRSSGSGGDTARTQKP